MSLSERQREILDAALERIDELGIQELTMKRIAATVGISEPALYRHFTSKSEILSAVVGEMETVSAQSLESARRTGRGSAEVLASFLESHSRRFAEHPALTAVLFSEDLFRNDPTLHSRVGAIVSNTQELLRREIEKGRASGDFRRDLEPEAAALMLAGGFRLLVSLWNLRGHNFDLIARTRSYLESAIKVLKG